VDLNNLRGSRLTRLSPRIITPRAIDKFEGKRNKCIDINTRPGRLPNTGPPKDNPMD